MAKAQTLLCLILVLCNFTVGAKTFINEIRYQGNEVTRASVLNREIYIRPGDEFNDALIERSRQAIMDLGLYKWVHYYLEEEYTDGSTGKGDSRINVVFIVKEKYYLLVIPRLKVVDNEFFYGLQFQGDNLFGLNHRSRLLVQDRGSIENIDENRVVLNYFYSNVNDSNFNLDFALQSENTVDESEGLVDRQDDSFRMGISRWLNPRGRNRGWFAGGSIKYLQRFNEDILITDNSESIEATILGAEIGYKNTNDFEYNRGGKAYGYRLEWTGDSIDSEAQFTKHLFYYRSYYRLKNRPLSNLNVQMKFGHSNDKVLGEYAFTLGSRNDLRGYEKNRFKGNTLFLTNVEYMFPQPEHPVIRYVTFVDVGSTYDQLSDVLHEPLNVGAGVGLRWKIRSLVKIDLRVDVAYGFTDDDYKFSFGTRHAF